MAIAQIIVKPYASFSSKSVDKIQDYAATMQNLLDRTFTSLAKAPDALYVMMATMGHESSFNIFHNGGTTPNHVSISEFRSGIGKRYWQDPVIVPIRDSGDPTIVKNVREGLSAKALMATMGMYQVRNCRESNAYVSGKYRDIAEANNLMVNPGESISTVFTNDDTGATRSMIMGCIIMEQKYLSRKRNHDDSSAIFYATGDYLGKAGAKDVLGTSPEMRVALINDGSNNIAKTLATAGIVRKNVSLVATNPLKSASSTAETKTTTTASTNLPPATGIGCAEG